MMLRPSEETRRNPHLTYAALRPAAVVSDASGEVWRALSYGAVKTVLTDHDTFSSAVAGGAPGKWLIFLDPPRHLKLRALISRAFTPRAVAALEPRIRELSRSLLERVEPGVDMDVVSGLALPLPLMVIAEMLGAPSADWPIYRA